MRLPPPPLAQTTGPASGSAPRGAHGAPGGGCGGAHGRRRFGWSSWHERARRGTREDETEVTKQYGSCSAFFEPAQPGSVGNITFHKITPLRLISFKSTKSHHISEPNATL
jgi:hypothetical protein